VSVIGIEMMTDESDISELSVENEKRGPRTEPFGTP